jgi:hypothetical protein
MRLRLLVLRTAFILVLMGRARVVVGRELPCGALLSIGVDSGASKLVSIKSTPSDEPFSLRLHSSNM